MISTDDSAERVWSVTGDFDLANAALSPSGRWMAYQANPSGQHQVYVRPFPQVEDDLIPMSNTGGLFPLWSRDGRDLFYMQPGSPPQLISVSLDSRDADGPLAVGGRAAIMDWPYVLGPNGNISLGGGRPYDVSPDGQRFLAIKLIAGEGDTTRPEINVVLNWFTELERLVPIN